MAPSFGWFVSTGKVSALWIMETSGPHKKALDLQFDTLFGHGSPGGRIDCR